jgi:hypothetical protein
MESTVKIDDQPISATFFGEGRWLSDFVTPDEPDILTLWHEISRGISSQQDRIVAAWDWVANQVKYKPFIAARISVEGVTSVQEDFWQSPAMCSKTHVGNCANKAFLLASLLRNDSLRIKSTSFWAISTTATPRAMPGSKSRSAVTATSWNPPGMMFPCRLPV